MRNRSARVAWLSLLLVLLAPFVGAEPRRIGDYTIVAGEGSFLDAAPPRNADGTINLVVEIPTGTNAKWEVEKPSGELRWEFRKGKPRFVAYLPYPGNYGMIPRTFQAPGSGGDGDPLDVILLGPALPRGEVARAKLIGILRLLDGGERDDKLIAVPLYGPLARVDDIEELDTRYPGISLILRTWFTNYKGPGKMEEMGVGEQAEALRALESAAAAWDEHQRSP
jgi:inorganic pyrophosphatase